MSKYFKVLFIILSLSLNNSCNVNKTDLLYNLNGNSLYKLFDIEENENNVLGDTSKINSLELGKKLFSDIKINNKLFFEYVKSKIPNRDSLINNGIMIDYIIYIKHQNPLFLETTNYYSIIYGDIKSKNRVFLYEKDFDKKERVHSFKIDKEVESEFKSILVITKNDLYKPPDSLIYRDTVEESLLLVRIISENKIVNYFMFNPIKTNQYLWGIANAAPEIRGAYLGTILLINSTFHLANLETPIL